jgi:hypothetical protein
MQVSVRPAKPLGKDLQDTLFLDRGWESGASAAHDGVLANHSPCLVWPYRAAAMNFIQTEVTRTPGAKHLKLPPILYVAASHCTNAVKYINRIVKVLRADVNAEYRIEYEVAGSMVVLGNATPLGWFLFITSWDRPNYNAYAPMLYELLRLGADPNTPCFTNFKVVDIRSPLYVALVKHYDPTMFFAKLLIDFGAKFSSVYDASPLVGAMDCMHRNVNGVIDLFDGNVDALGGMQNKLEPGRAAGSGTAMHCFLLHSLNPLRITEASLRDIVHYMDVLHKQLHVSMTIRSAHDELPSDYVRRVMTQPTTDDQERCLQALLAHVLELELHEPRGMTVAADGVLKRLPPELATLTRQAYLDQDSRFRRRLALGI